MLQIANIIIYIISLKGLYWNCRNPYDKVGISLIAEVVEALRIAEEALSIHNAVERNKKSNKRL